MLIDQHILPEQLQIKYPYCSEGQRACPPEDVGGVHGFAEYLEVMADSDHEEHEGFMTWRGPFDPDLFDVEGVNRALGKAFRRRKG